MTPADERREALKRAQERQRQVLAGQQGAVPEFREISGVMTSPYPTRWEHQGPASDLPGVYGDEQFSRFVPTDDRNSPPFSREFSFVERDPLDPGPPRGRKPTVASIGQRAQAFKDRFFDGVDSPVYDPATGRQYGKELLAHDALHEFTNVGNTLWAEELLTSAEPVANAPLGAAGLRGLTQQPSFVSNRFNSDFAYKEAEKYSDNMTRMTGKDLVQQRGQKRGSSLFRDRNAPTSFLSPPISDGERGEMIRRSQEFYDQVHADWKDFSRGSTAADHLPGRQSAFRTDAPSVLAEDFLNQRLENIKIEGGYGNKNSLGFGNIKQFMNPPLVPTVDSTEWAKSLDRQLSRDGRKLTQRLEKEIADYDLPAQEERARRLTDYNELVGEIRGAINEVGIRGEDWSPWDAAISSGKMTREEARRNDAVVKSVRKALELDGEYPLDRGWIPPDVVEGEIARVIGPKPESPVRPGGVLNYMRESSSNRVTSAPKFVRQVKEEMGPLTGRRLLEKRVDADLLGRNLGRGIGAGVPFDSRDDLIYLNPPNLGANNAARSRRGLAYREPGMQFPPELVTEDILLTAARDAKDARLVKGAVRAGASVVGDSIGSLPLLDPKFREAVDEGRVGDAAVRAGTEYAVGAVTAPAVGMAAGVLQRAAPRAAARVLPAVAGASRVGNPTAVVSQLGGDSRRSQAQRAVDSQAAARQRNAAIQARQRGPKWQIPTPWGPVKIPELGITEGKGLFIGGNKSGRRLGTRGVVNGVEKVWTGDSFGWQSPASAAKLGVR